MNRRPAASTGPSPVGFDYGAPAEMFMTRARLVRKSPVAYRRFVTAAEAIRFAVEEIPAAQLVGAVLEVNEQRYDHRRIRELYDTAPHLRSRGPSRAGSPNRDPRK